MDFPTVYRARVAAKLSLHECANKLGIKPITLSNIERGRFSPPDDLKAKIVALLGDVHFVTPEEATKADAEAEAEINILFAARARIIEDAAGSKPAQGSVECAKCGGNLRYSIASNGHVHAHCSTGGCLSWME